MDWLLWRFSLRCGAIGAVSHRRRGTPVMFLLSGSGFARRGGPAMRARAMTRPSCDGPIRMRSRKSCKAIGKACSTRSSGRDIDDWNAQASWDPRLAVREPLLASDSEVLNCITTRCGDHEPDRTGANLVPWLAGRQRWRGRCVAQSQPRALSQACLSGGAALGMARLMGTRGGADP